MQIVMKSGQILYTLSPTSFLSDWLLFNIHFERQLDGFRIKTFEQFFITFTFTLRLYTTKFNNTTKL